MILFGGLNAPNFFTFIYYNDVWVLTNANGLGGTPQWIQLTPAGTPPTPRAAHSALYDPLANRLIVFGGSVFNPVTGIGNSFDETWVLENANGIGGSPNWVQVTPTGGPPPGRFGHSAGYSPASGRMVVAMGRGNSDVLLDDAWVLAFKRVARLLDRDGEPEHAVAAESPVPARHLERRNRPGR